MNQYIYTKREVQILKALSPLAITDEEFLALCHKAYRHDRMKHFRYLVDTYPDISDRVFSIDFMDQHKNTADREANYLYPILCPSNRHTEGRIKNMVCYLTGGLEWSESMQQTLYESVPYRLVFNYVIDEYVKDFDADALWDVFFLGQTQLSHMLHLRSIFSLDVLVYRAAEYFDRYGQSSCAECGIGDWKGATYGEARGKKPHRKVCSKNGDQRIF